MKIRKARVEDAASLVGIKEKLPMPSFNDTDSRGGFLLGTSEPVYRFYIENASCMVAEISGEIVGFGIIFQDQLVKASDIWQKRTLANWAIPLAEIENKKLCYFEQLAFLPNYRRLAAPLAYELLQNSFCNDGHDAMITTTVRQPVLNIAAVSFIIAAGGSLVGNIAEHYEGVGDINSDIYLIEKTDFIRYTEKLNISSRSRNLRFSISS